eukprot:scaffold194861_cov15-Tisochrysis_lutea.AAC.1
MASHLLPSRPAMLAPTPVAAVLLMGSPPSPPLSCSAWSLDIATGLSPNVKNCAQHRPRLTSAWAQSAALDVDPAPSWASASA